VCAIPLRPNSQRACIWAHALYFIIGGLWAVVGRRSFEVVTGPKADYWLVRTVGGLLTVSGLVIASASIRDRITPEIRWLAIGSSSVLVAIDAIFAAKGRIRAIYWLDAAANVVLISGWLLPAPPPGASAEKTAPLS
jgi:cytochrome b subunit of formate dehydrogenase